MFESIIIWLESVTVLLVDAISALGYTGIFLLMMVESSAFPFPSELVMPPAGYLVSQGRMNMWLVVLAGGLGSLAGAYVNYYGALYLGRPLLLQYGRFIGLAEGKLVKTEVFFRQHGEISTFIGRLLPVVRHLISIPAGLSRMNHLRFSAYTLLGAFIWCSILTWIGYMIGHNQELIMAYSKQAVLWVIVGCCLLLAGYLWHVRRKSSARSLAVSPPVTGE